MKNPSPANLKTSDQVRKAGWQAESRDADGHLVTCHAPISASDTTIAEWIAECTANGETITIWPAAAADSGAQVETDVSDSELLREVIGDVLTYRDMDPEEDENWESWYYAAFDMLVPRIRETFARNGRRHGGVGRAGIQSDSSSGTQVASQTCADILASMVEDGSPLVIDLIREIERAMKQRDEYLKTGVSTAAHGGWDTCLVPILTKHLLPLPPTTRTSEYERREQVCVNTAMSQWERSLKRADLSEKDRVTGALEAFKRQAFAFSMLELTSDHGTDKSKPTVWRWKFEGSGPWHEGASVPEGVYHSEPVPPAPSADLKPLVWLDDAVGGFVADCAFGQYEMHEVGYMEATAWELINAVERVGYYDSVEKAKSAAEADYMKRIANAFSPTLAHLQEHSA